MSRRHLKRSGDELADLGSNERGPAPDALQELRGYEGHGRRVLPARGDYREHAAVEHALSAPPDKKWRLRTEIYARRIQSPAVSTGYIGDDG